eukprot:4406188-Pyramimonas_sp.AAC.1
MARRLGRLGGLAQTAVSVTRNLGVLRTPDWWADGPSTSVSRGYPAMATGERLWPRVGWTSSNGGVPHRTNLLRRFYQLTWVAESE